MRSDDIFCYALHSFPLSPMEKGFRLVGLRFGPVGLQFWPVGLRFRPVGLQFWPVSLRFRPMGLRFRQEGLCFRPQGLKSSVFVFRYSFSTHPCIRAHWLITVSLSLGVRFLQSERIQKWILRFFTRQINPISFGSWCVKGVREIHFQSGLFRFQ